MTNIRAGVAVYHNLLSPIVGARSVVCRLALATFALASASTPSRADEPLHPPLSFTAAEFLARVEKSNPRFEVLEGDVAWESAAVTAAGLWSNPTLAYDRQEIFTGDQRFPENILRAELPFEISGRRGLKVEGAELGVAAAREQAARARKDILLDALGVYFRAAAARQRLDVLRAERVVLGRLVEAVKSRTAAGDASGYDLDRLAIEAEAQGDLIADAERELAAYRRALGMLVGDSSARLDASDTLALPIYTANSPGTSILASHPAYRAAALRVQQAETELRAAGRGWVPTLSVSGGAKSALNDTDTRWGYVAGLTLFLPFLDYGQADAERARARLRSARAGQRFVEQQVLVQTGTGDEALVRVVQQARRYEETQLPRLDRLVRRAETSYQEGERPVFELLDAYRTARGVRLRAIELRQQARLAEVELWRARGLGPGGNP